MGWSDCATVHVPDEKYLRIENTLVLRYSTVQVGVLILVLVLEYVTQDRDWRRFGLG